MKLAIVHVFAALVALARAAAPEARSFDYTTHLGNLSPYFKPPVPSGIKETLPEDCTVDQVMLVRLQLIIPYIPQFPPFDLCVCQSCSPDCAHGRLCIA